MFYVIELQTTASTGSAIPYAHAEQADAEAQYHSLLSVAAKSNVPQHTVLLLGPDGFRIKGETYFHNGGEE